MRENKANVLKWILDSARGVGRGVVLLTLVQSAISVTAVVFAVLLQQVVDHAVAGDRGGLISWLALLAALIVLQILLKATVRFAEERVKARAENSLKTHTYNVILSRSYAAVTARHSGELLTRLTSDVSIIINNIVAIFPNLVAVLVKLAGAAAVLFAMDWRFTLIYLVGGAFLFAVTAVFRKKLKAMHKRVQSADGKVRSFLQETLSNLLVIRTFGYEQGASNTAQQHMAEHMQRRIERNIVSVLCNMGFGLMMHGGYLFGLAWCAMGIVNGTVSYGSLTAVLQLVSQMQTPFANMSAYLSKYYEMIASAERLMELENLPEDKAADACSMSTEERKQVYDRLSAIAFRDVSFAYDEREGDLVLDQVNLAISKRDFVAIMGHSGIGKSTLLKLLLAVYEPCDGAVQLETADDRTIGISPYTRPMFSYVPQESYILSGTIGQAVAPLGETAPDRETVERACRIACADFVFDLPHGIDTMVGEKGMGLSEGQKQRLAIARAIYADSPVLLLDEATSALDGDTEQRVLRNIRDLTDKTVLIVTHRTGALDYCNRVVTLKNMKIIE